VCTNCARTRSRRRRTASRSDPPRPDIPPSAVPSIRAAGDLNALDSARPLVRLATTVWTTTTADDNRVAP
jgi:hypothetical protein